FYFGACAGGVWKTNDAGQYWECVSDGFFKTSSVGALAVSELDPNVIYAGMGEATIRIDVSHGDGVYKSTNGGRSWQHMGLEDTRHIGKIRIHPHDPDTVFVAALGHAFGNNKERGVFKSTDGGKTWRNVLFKSEKAGAVDICIDPNNPRIIYATIWEAYRNFWQISSGGEDSGLWKSTDGGETWTDISRNKGMPDGVLGKIGVAASPAKAGRVWALIENEKGGMYRSDDYGDTWEYVAANNDLVSRAWYYIHVTADPQDGDTVYVNNLRLWKSIDGGRNYDMIQTPHGDNHDIWIDPKNNRRMIQGNDGGACVSVNGGDTWSSIFNQPTAQFYHVATDNRDPYFVYGTQQDNSSLAVPSRVRQSSITWADGYVAGTGESGYIAPKPDNPNVVFLGAIGSSPGGGNALQRYDHESKYVRLVTTWPELMSGEGAIDYKYRFAWTYPILFSPHDPNTLYAAGNIVFKTTNEGQSWEPISPDLTRADPDKLQITGGPINRDSVGAEAYATVFAFAESPHEAGVFWAGSDDGLVHISKDGGKNWTDITPKDLPEWSMVSILEPSPHDPATCYMATTRYKLDDYAPYLYKTSDYGATWTRINKGIRDDDFTRVIRCDPTRKGLLYAGTETGLYISFDDGANWQPFQLNLPVTPIHDIVIKNNDLIAATHGRAF
ncbi:MAG: glycosyl hydrolase, partial [Anaerolineae bacterium]|nr:glycosyl hydrolase [Anaerolineae bacterium]